MTVLLVLFTLLLFLGADFFVQRSRAARRARVHSPAPVLPEDAVLLHNHTWTRPDRRGTIVVGVDALLARALGAMERIILPRPGEELTHASPGIGLAAGRGMLRLVAPVAGRVVEVNPEVLRNPGLAASDPYGAGWLLKVSATGSGPDEAWIVRRPLEWLTGQRDAMREFFLKAAGGAEPALMQDGGEPVPGILQQFDEEVWHDFQATFAALQRPEPEPVGRQERRS